MRTYRVKAYRIDKRKKRNDVWVEDPETFITVGGAKVPVAKGQSKEEAGNAFVAEKQAATERSSSDIRNEMRAITDRAYSAQKYGTQEELNYLHDKYQKLEDELVWDKEYPEVEKLYSEGRRVMQEGVRYSSREQKEYGKEKIREGVNRLRNLQKTVNTKNRNELQSVIDNWNDEINYQYSR